MAGRCKFNSILRWTIRSCTSRAGQAGPSRCPERPPPPAASLTSVAVCRFLWGFRSRGLGFRVQGSGPRFPGRPPPPVASPTSAAVRRVFRSLGLALGCRPGVKVQGLGTIFRDILGLLLWGCHIRRLSCSASGLLHISHNTGFFTLSGALLTFTIQAVSTLPSTGCTLALRNCEKKHNRQSDAGTDNSGAMTLSARTSDSDSTAATVPSRCQNPNSNTLACSGDGQFVLEVFASL